MFLGVAALGDVLHRALVADEAAAGVPHRVGVLGDPDARAVPAAHFRLEVDDFTAGFHDVAEDVAAARFDVEPALDVRQVGHQFVGRGVAVEAGEGRIGCQVVPVLGGLEDAFRGVLEDVAVAQLGVRQGFEGYLSWRDVLDEALDHRAAVFIGHRNAAFDDPAEFAGAGDDAVFEAEPPPFPDGLADLLAHPRQVVRVGERHPRQLRVVNDVGRGVAGQGGAALAGEDHGPLGVVQAAVNHALQIVHEGVEHPCPVQGLGGEKAGAALASGEWGHVSKVLVRDRGAESGKLHARKWPTEHGASSVLCTSMVRMVVPSPRRGASMAPFQCRVRGMARVNSGTGASKRLPSSATIR